MLQQTSCIFEGALDTLEMAPLALPAQRQHDGQAERGAVRKQLMLFVNCLVDNPEFDSQSKEALSTPPEQMGGPCVLPDSYANAVAQIPTLAELVGEDRKLRSMRALASKVAKGRAGTNLHIPKLEDAELAGGASAAEVRSGASTPHDA